MVLGRCPYCDANVIEIKTIARGKKVKLYTCEKAKKEHDDSEAFVFTADSDCTFRIYSNALLRYNKRSISSKEIRNLLKDKQIKVRLHGRKGTKEYFKYAIPHREYGISILWDEEVEDDFS